MTDREKAIVMAYTGVCTLQGDKLPVFYDYVEEIMGSRMDTLQMAILADEIKRKAEPDFIKICEDATDKNVGGKWISAKDNPPKYWRADDEERTLINYIVYSPDYGVDIGNYVKPAKQWLCMGLPMNVTHWMPLPEPPKEAEDANR